MTFASEKDFGENFVRFLRIIGFETWQEVTVGGHVVDCIGKFNDKYYSFELKLSWCDTVLEQASRNHQHYNFVVVPKIGKYISEVKEFFIDSKKINIMEFSGIDDNFESLVPELLTHRTWTTLPPFDSYTKEVSFVNPVKILKRHLVEHDHPINTEKYLFDDLKESLAGMTSGGAITPFKRSCRLIVEHIQANGYSNKKQLWNDLSGKLHWASYNSMCSSFRAYGHVKEIKDILELIRS